MTISKEWLLKMIEFQLSGDDANSMMPYHKFTLWFNPVQEAELLSTIGGKFWHEGGHEWAEFINTNPSIEDVVTFLKRAIDGDDE